MLIIGLKGEFDLPELGGVSCSDVAPGASSFTLFPKPDRAPIIAGAAPVRTEHRFSHLSPIFRINHPLFVAYQLLVLYFVEENKREWLPLCW